MRAAQAAETESLKQQLEDRDAKLHEIKLSSEEASSTHAIRRSVALAHDHLTAVLSELSEVPNQA